MIKKNIADYGGLFFAIVITFAVAVFVLILYSAYNNHIEGELNNALTSSTAVDPNANVTKILEGAGDGVGRFNILFPLLIVGVLAFVAIMALFTESHGSFFFIGFIVLGVGIILAVAFSNVYEAIGAKSEFSSADSELSIMGWFLDNLPLVLLIIFVMIGVILYAMPKSPGGGSY